MTEADTLLYLDGVTVSFDGFRALNALSLVLQEGEMRAVIGPNGAGKTTFMDIDHRQDEARRRVSVLWQGRHRPRRHELDEPAIAARGDRPQVPEARPCSRPHTVVAENLLTSRWQATLASALKVLFARRDRRSRRRRGSRAIARGRWASRGQLSRRAGELSHGQKQWLEIGMLLAQEPQNSCWWTSPPPA